MTDAETIARACAAAAAEKKAADIVALEMTEVSSFTDFFVVCSADSEPQLKAIGSEIRRVLREDHGRKTLSEDGFPASQWIVLDYGDVIVHIFQGDKRGHYGLEKLWSDARRIDLGGLT